MFTEQYLRPGTVEGALDLLTTYGDDAKVVAGGQSVMVLLHEGLLTPRVLIGLSGVAGLDAITVSPSGGASIGAMATHTQVLSHPGIRSSWPVLAAAEEAVSSVQIRNRGTLCGNLAHAYPTADPPAALLAVDAELTLRSPRGSRQAPVSEFAIGPLTTILDPDELVTAVTLPPAPSGARYAYLKYAVRPLDFAILGVAVRVCVDSGGRMSQVRIGLNGAAGRPLRATDAEAILEGAVLPGPASASGSASTSASTVASAEVFAAAASAAAAQSEPLDEVFESSAYRREMVGVYVRRALEAALR